MATINFPASPALNDTYTFNNNTWLWNGGGWQKQAPTITYIAPVVQTASVTGSTTINWASKDVTRLTLTGNTAITNSGAVDGQKMVLQLIQGGTGSYTVSFTAETIYGTTITSITLSTAVGKMDMVGLTYSASNSKYNIVAYAAGY